MPQLTAIVYATGVLTFTDVALNTQVVVVGGKTYTFQDTLTDVDGNVHVGADAENDILNLVAAINLAGGTAGTDYATSMTKNVHVRAVATSATVMTVFALVPGAVGNFIPSTETQTNASWGAAVLASGAGHSYTAVQEILDEGQVNSDVIRSLLSIDSGEVSNS